MTFIESIADIFNLLKKIAFIAGKSMKLKKLID
jgi:hypothetical protein